MDNRTRAALAFAFAAGLFALPLAAFAVGNAADAASTIASDPTSPATVTIPWGDWLGSLLAGAATLLVAFLTRLVAMAPAAIRAFVTNDVIEKAVDYAIATTRDAARGREATIEVSNQLIAVALRWIVDNEPKIAGWANDKLRPLIAARLSALNVIAAEASSNDLAVKSPASGAA